MSDIPIQVIAVEIFDDHSWRVLDLTPSEYESAANLRKPSTSIAHGGKNNPDKIGRTVAGLLKRSTTVVTRGLVTGVSGTIYEVEDAYIEEPEGKPVARGVRNRIVVDVSGKPFVSGWIDGADLHLAENRIEPL